MTGCGKHASSDTTRRTANAKRNACASDGARIACKQDRKEEANVSEIVNMSQKIRALVDQLTSSASPGERVSFEMMMTFAYTEGYKDGYSKGYVEAALSLENIEGGNGEL